MYLEPDRERLGCLSLEYETATGEKLSYRDGAQITFCPHCEFQYLPDTLGPSQCPDCHSRLHVTTMSNELRALVKQVQG